jgi:hypothetical protein
VTGAPWVDGPEAVGFDSVLVRFSSGVVLYGRDAFGQIELVDSATPVSKLQISTTLGVSSAPNSGDTVTAITGFGHFSFCRRKIRPRNDSDVFITPQVLACGAGPRANHLLISEISVTPTASEFVEIFNPTTNTINLSNTYLFNATFNPTTDGGCRYYTPQDPPGTCGSAFSDFHLQFPPGASIAPSEAQVIALVGAPNYCTVFNCSGGALPNYEIPAPGIDDPSVTNMLGVWDPNVNIFPDGGAQSLGFLTNAGEDVILYSWSGSTPTVQDVDYVVYGTGPRSDKTGTLTYLPDTPTASQVPASLDAGPGSIALMSIQRVCLNEGAETSSNGNGITGHDETSENLLNTFRLRDKTPKIVAPGSVP